MNEISIKIENIYIPIKPLNTLDPQRVENLAQDILEHGLTTPVLVRRDETRFVGGLQSAYRGDAVLLIGPVR